MMGSEDFKYTYSMYAIYESTVFELFWSKKSCYNEFEFIVIHLRFQIFMVKKALQYTTCTIEFIKKY